MSEVANSASTAKKSGASKAPKKPRTTPNHPKVSEMVTAAISNLKERGGSSLQAIKKYIGANYNVDVEKLATFIRKYLKTAVTNGTLIQTKGKGASGSFKLGSVSKKSEKESAVKKPKPPKKVVKSKPKESKKVVKKPKASPSSGKVSSPKKVATKQAKSPKKASKEKVKKTPTKAKTPKPKKASAKAPKSSAPKQETSASAQD